MGLSQSRARIGARGNFPGISDRRDSKWSEVRGKDVARNISRGVGGLAQEDGKIYSKSNLNYDLCLNRANCSYH